MNEDAERLRSKSDQGYIEGTMNGYSRERNHFTGGLRMKIREAIETDFEQLLPLLVELLKRPMDDRAELRKIFEKGLRSENRAIFVAEGEGKVQGLITLSVYHKEAFYANCDIADIDEFIVSTEARGGGAANLLMERAIRYAEERGCRFMELWSRLNNERAHAFYEKHGFQKTGLFLQRPM
jgi:ribosomal protein S18 acetylase RimI-like enzyme